MPSAKSASKATRQLRQSGLPLARAAVHVGRRKRKSPILGLMLGVGCMALLGVGAAIAMVALKPEAQVVAAAAPAVVAPAPVAAPEPAPVVVAVAAPAVVESAPVSAPTEFATRRATELAVMEVPEADTATLLSNLQAAAEPAIAVVEPDCRSTLNAEAQRMNVTFGISSNALDPAMAEALDALATKAADCAGVQIVVAGHSDTTGSAEANMALSWQRADEVVAAIVGMGHDAALFNAVGYGARNPVMVDGMVDEAASRRVEFMVTMADVAMADEVSQ